MMSEGFMSALHCISLSAASPNIRKDATTSGTPCKGTWSYELESLDNSLVMPSKLGSPLREGLPASTVWRSIIAGPLVTQAHRARLGFGHVLFQPCTPVSQVSTSTMLFVLCCKLYVMWVRVVNNINIKDNDNHYQATDQPIRPTSQPPTTNRHRPTNKTTPTTTNDNPTTTTTKTATNHNNTTQQGRNDNNHVGTFPNT